MGLALRSRPRVRTTPLSLLAGLSLPVKAIPAGQSVPFTITFHPTSVGSASATLTATSNAREKPTTSTETLTGTGTALAGQLSISPSTLAVGNVVDGSSELRPQEV